MIKNKLKILAILGAAATSNTAYSQSLGSAQAILKKLEHDQKSPEEYDTYLLEGRKFFVAEDAADHQEKHILEFLPSNRIQLVEVIDDKTTKDHFSNIFTGDVVRNHNNISVRADRLEGKKIAMPVVYNFLLNHYRGYWYLVDINTRDKWLETNTVSKTPQSQK